MELTLSKVQQVFAPPFCKHPFHCQVAPTKKKSPKAYSKSVCSLDGFTDEILATPARGIYFFRLCNRFLEYFLRYLLSNRTRFQRCAVLTGLWFYFFYFLFFWGGGGVEAFSGLVVRRRILNSESGVYPIQNEFRGLGPRGLQVTSVGVAVASLFASSTGRVRFDVLAQVVTPHKALVTHRASKPFLAGVGAQVSLELIGPSEPFATEKPVADKRPLAGVPSQMRLEVRCLSVHFTAAGNVAAMESLSPQAGPGGS